MISAGRFYGDVDHPLYLIPRVHSTHLTISLITNRANMGVSPCTRRPMIVQIADARRRKKLIAGRPLVPDIRGRRPVRPHTCMVDPPGHTRVRRSIEGSEMPERTSAERIRIDCA
jgi:hypothetical protein